MNMNEIQTTTSEYPETGEQILWFEELSMDDLPRVGGKNASLGEMISSLSQAGVRVPGGFATTAEAFRKFLDHNRLPQRIDPLLERLDVNDVVALAEAGRTVRQWVMEAELPAALKRAVTTAYERMTVAGRPPAVAVRSSATAEDLPDASFAGQQETYLNVTGAKEVLRHIRLVFASLYNDRAIAYRVTRVSITMMWRSLPASSAWPGPTWAPPG